MNDIKYFSGGCQDKWVDSVLNKKTNGFFIEVGALDGIESSNTFVFEKYYNWNGICIEPTPSLYTKLLKNRKCICDNSCIDGCIHEVDFVIAEGDIRGLGGIKSCIRHPHAVKLENTIKLTTNTLFNILVKYNCPNQIDYLSIDIEGSEKYIFENFPFSIYQFKCITVETKDCNDILIKNGYEIVKNPFIENTCDVHFIKK